MIYFIVCRSLFCILNVQIRLFSAAVGLNTPLSTGTVEVEIDDVIGWYV